MMELLRKIARRMNSAEHKGSKIDENLASDCHLDSYECSGCAGMCVCPACQGVEG